MNAFEDRETLDQIRSIWDQLGKLTETAMKAKQYQFSEDLRNIADRLKDCGAELGMRISRSQASLETLKSDPLLEMLAIFEEDSLSGLLQATVKDGIVSAAVARIAGQGEFQMLRPLGNSGQPNSIIHPT